MPCVRNALQLVLDLGPRTRCRSPRRGPSSIEKRGPHPIVARPFSTVTEDPPGIPQAATKERGNVLSAETRSEVPSPPSVAKKSDRGREAAAREATRRPDVVVDVHFEDGLLFVSVSNIGDEPALRLSCRFDNELRGLGGTKNLAELPLFRNIEFLAPGKEIRTLLDSSSAFFGRDEPTKLAVTISYHDAAGREHETTIHHDLAIYRELAYVPKGVQRDA